MDEPQITGGELDADDDSDANPVPDAKDLGYVPAADATVAALRADKGLVVAEVNQYLPLVTQTLANAASAFPGAGNLIGAILKIIPKQI